MSEVSPLILIIDDDSDFSSIVEDKLTASGFAVATVDSGEEALEWVKKQKPDLVLLDLRMPVMDGSQVLDKLKKTPGFDDVKILVVTSFNEFGSMQISDEFVKKVGGDGFVEKNIELDDLVERVQKTLGMFV